VARNPCNQNIRDVATEFFTTRTLARPNQRASTSTASLKSDKRVRDIATSLGFSKMWLWDVDSLDWKHLGNTHAIFHSDDRGETWKAEDDGAPSPSSRIQRFVRIGTRSGTWRIVDRKDGGFDLQHHEKRGWQAVKDSPG